MPRSMIFNQTEFLAYKSQVKEFPNSENSLFTTNRDNTQLLLTECFRLDYYVASAAAFCSHLLFEFWRAFTAIATLSPHNPLSALCAKKDGSLEASLFDKI